MAFPCKNISSIKQVFPENKSISWIYLGRNLFKKRDIEQKLGNCFNHINIAGLHNKVAEDLREEYVCWIDDLNRLYGKNLEWWFGTISSKNPYDSNIFQYCCYLEILERSMNKDNKPELVVIESVGLTRAIQKWASRRNIVVTIIHYNRAKLESLKYSIFFFLRWGYSTVTLILRWMAAYITKKKYQPEKMKIDSCIIVDTFLHDYCLSDDGTFKDRYFPYLHEYLSEKNVAVLVHPVLFGFRYNYFSIYKKMRISKTNFIFREDFLHFSDYFSALIYPLKILRQEINAASFRNFDIYDILTEEKKQQSFTSGMEAVLIYRLFLRLGQSGIKPKQIIDWYENQVIDKALIAGARQAFPEAKIIGAQMFIHSPNFISQFPSQSEVDTHIVPHILLETSRHQCQVARSFTKTIPCKSVAALRYSHVFKNISNPVLEQKTQKILVLLPFSMDEAVELLETLKEVQENIRSSVGILIKGHPDYDSKELIQAFGEDDWPDRFEIFHGALPDALKLASMVISSNSSSMVEAVAKGIPLIFLGNQTILNQNLLSNLNMDIVTECFSTTELVLAIEKYLNLSPEEKTRYKEMGNRIRDIFFEPMNEETLLPFLNIEDDI